MLFTSESPAIKLVDGQTLWSWLFESCIPKFPRDQIQGFTDAFTQKHISFTDLKRHTKALSTVFYNNYGVRQGDVIIVYSHNSIWYPVISLAAVRIGAIACGVSPDYTVDELIYALRLTKSKLLWAGDDTVQKAREAAAIYVLPSKSILRLNPAEDGLKSIEDLLKMGAQLNDGDLVPQFRIPQGKSNREICAYLCLSSGTTGLPKAVMISHANIIAQCLQVQQITPQDHDKIVAALPFYHITGIVHEVHLPIVINAHAFVLSKYSLDSLLDTVSRHKIKELLIVPPILIRMVQDTKTVAKYDLTHVRRFSSGAAPLPQEILDLLERKFPNTGFKQGYGMTESCSAITSHPPSKYAYQYANRVGMLVGSTEAKIIDPNTGKACGVGEAGDIWARGPQVTMGYLENPSATAEAYDSEGFLHTGDIGHFDEEGLLSITDRIKDMIKVKGIGVAPAELEDLLLGHPAVSDVAVCRIPDQRAGERPKAFVVLRRSENLSPVQVGKAIISYTKSKKARHKWIAEVEFVDAIPKSPAGKILRRKLQERPEGSRNNIIVRDIELKAKL